jgi:anionic cell wall polymer biosynthesis LytR-Cps2A-Psr (LCP) family protein
MTSPEVRTRADLLPRLESVGRAGSPTANDGNLSRFRRCARIAFMTVENQNKERKSSETPRPRRRQLARATLWSMLLLVAFVVVFGYAALTVYQWAHAAALAISWPGQEVSPSSLVLPAPAQAELPDRAPALDLPVETAPAVDAVEAEAAPPSSADQRITFLLLGVDQRPDDPSPSRTDNMIVVTVDPETSHVGMISLPRDLFVPIPEYQYSGKINTAYYLGELNKYPGGGGALAKKTVSEFLGYPVDYYVKINFDGFHRGHRRHRRRGCGGVQDHPRRRISYHRLWHRDLSHRRWPAASGRRDRAEVCAHRATLRTTISSVPKRQQQVLLAIKDKLIENKLLTPVRLLELLRVVSNSVDYDIPATRLPNLLALASRVQLDQIEQLVIDTRYAQVDANSRFGWILVPNREKLRPAVDQIFLAEAAPAAEVIDVAALAQQQARQQAALARQQVFSGYQAQGELLRQQLSAEGARVGVYNGTGDPILTARAADWLQRQGYNVVEAKEADRSDYPRTALVTYGQTPVATEGLKEMFAIANANISTGDRSAETDLDLRLIILDFYLLVSN